MRCVQIPLDRYLGFPKRARVYGEPPRMTRIRVIVFSNGCLAQYYDVMKPDVVYRETMFDDLSFVYAALGVDETTFNSWGQTDVTDNRTLVPRLRRALTPAEMTKTVVMFGVDTGTLPGDL